MKRWQDVIERNGDCVIDKNFFSPCNKRWLITYKENWTDLFDNQILFVYVRLLHKNYIFIHVIGRCKRNAAKRYDVIVNSQEYSAEKNWRWRTESIARRRSVSDVPGSNRFLKCRIINYQQRSKAVGVVQIQGNWAPHELKLKTLQEVF